MTTAIQLSKETVERLNRLREEEGVDTHEDLIRILIRSRKTLKTSQRGKYPQARTLRKGRE